MAVDFPGKNTSILSELLTGGDEFPSDDQNWSSSESAFNGFGSSSDLNTPVGSELDSTETESDDDGFMAELTRQMADYMLEEGEEDCENWSSNGKRIVGPHVKPTGFLSHQQASVENNNRKLLPTNHFNYQLRNEQHVRSSSGGRRGKKTESTQHLRTNQQFHPIALSQAAGSGMRAVFLGGLGSRSASSGTGVFLPRDNTVALEPRKKGGCSTVLIPARVLQALEVHFNNMDTMPHSKGGPTSTPCPNQHDVVVGGGVYRQQKRQLDSQTRPTMNYDKETQLPQEWTY